MNEVSLVDFNFIETYSQTNSDIIVQVLSQQLALKKLKIQVVASLYLFVADHNFQFRLTSLDIDIWNIAVSKSF